ncbi:hypothetical protein FAF44_46850, partial [Nonomuraea sp. MG754425]|uniref:aldo/keto reductase n=1 Tax=Nonomuraea sp. MG754425 TaxID=2570319 RepID=UPI001F3B7F72
HIDTAGTYGFGDLHAHELIRQALSPYPKDLMIATKVSSPGEAAAAQLSGLVEQDLRRLGRDHLDLVHLRVGDAGGESLGEGFTVLADLRREGLIRHLGVSHVDEARSIAPVAAVQSRFRIHDRKNAEALARCERDGIACVPYFPLAAAEHASTRLAVVTVQLQQNIGGRWIAAGTRGRHTLASGTGGRGKRATGRAACISSTTTGWRSVIEVDLVGAMDTPDTLTTVARNIPCRR